MAAFVDYSVAHGGNLVEDSGSHQLVVELLVNDYREFLSHRKGKSRADRLTDADVSLQCWEQELQQQQQNISDHRMAQSIAEATVSDQSLLLQSLDEETLASSDHRLARSLGGPDEAHQANGDDDLNRCTITTGVEIGEVLKDLAQLKLANDHGRSSVGPSNGVSSNCISCLDAIRTEVFTPGCGHSYCKNCVHDHFVAATKDEELYPPRCCGQVFAPGMALRILNYQELSAFAMKGTEFSCKERTYCAEPTCSTFIPPWHIKQESAQCPQCGRITHTKCKTIGNPNHDCPSDPDLQMVLELGNEAGWRRCSQCRMLVELHQGCNHITCRCGKHFCYACGADWRTCDCPLWHEDRLLGIANRVVDDDVQPAADDAERAVALARVIDQLRHHEDVGCQHARRSQWKWRDRPGTQCEVCFQTLPHYIFECRSCRLLACNRCIRNRLR